jgi:hypothetical protein
MSYTFKHLYLYSDWLWAECLGFDSQQEQSYFSLSPCSDWLWTHTAILREKQLDYEGDCCTYLN